MNLQKRLDLVALILSLVFNPAFLLIIFFLSLIFSLQERGVSQLLGLEVLATIWLIPVAISVYFLRKNGLISDWSLTKQRERHVFNLVVLIWGVLTFLAAASFQLLVLVNYLGLILIWFGLFTLLTLRWKVSAHTSTLTLFVLLLYMLTGGGLMMGLMGIFLVSWTRLRRKKHTIEQVIGGIGLSVVFVLLASYLGVV